MRLAVAWAAITPVMSIVVVAMMTLPPPPAFAVIPIVRPSVMTLIAVVRAAMVAVVVTIAMSGNLNLTGFIAADFGCIGADRTDREKR